MCTYSSSAASSSANDEACRLLHHFGRLDQQSSNNQQLWGFDRVTLPGGWVRTRSRGADVTAVVFVCDSVVHNLCHTFCDWPLRLLSAAGVTAGRRAIKSLTSKGYSYNQNRWCRQQSTVSRRRSPAWSKCLLSLSRTWLRWWNRRRSRCVESPVFAFASWLANSDTLITLMKEFASRGILMDGWITWKWDNFIHEI